MSTGAYLDSRKVSLYLSLRGSVVPPHQLVRNLHSDHTVSNLPSRNVTTSVVDDTHPDGRLLQHLGRGLVELAFNQGRVHFAWRLRLVSLFWLRVFYQLLLRWLMFRSSEQEIFAVGMLGYLRFIRTLGR